MPKTLYNAEWYEPCLYIHLSLLSHQSARMGEHIIPESGASMLKRWTWFTSANASLTLPVAQEKIFWRDMIMANLGPPHGWKGMGYPPWTMAEPHPLPWFMLRIPRRVPARLGAEVTHNRPRAGHGPSHGPKSLGCYFWCHTDQIQRALSWEITAWWIMDQYSAWSTWVFLMPNSQEARPVCHFSLRHHRNTQVKRTIKISCGGSNPGMGGAPVQCQRSRDCKSIHCCLGCSHLGGMEIYKSAERISKMPTKKIIIL